MRLLLILWAAAFAVVAQAHVLVYTGTYSATTTGGGVVTKTKLTAVLIVDTEVLDPDSDRPNAALWLLRKVGKVYSVAGYIDLDNDLDGWESFTVTGAKAVSYQTFAGQDVPETPLATTLLLQGKQTPNVILYRNPDTSPVSDTVAKALAGPWLERGADGDDALLTQGKLALKLSKLTAEVNPSTTPADFVDAVAYVFEVLTGGPPPPAD